jgi:hypothetical protein
MSQLRLLPPGSIAVKRSLFKACPRTNEHFAAYTVEATNSQSELLARALRTVPWEAHGAPHG